MRAREGGSAYPIDQLERAGVVMRSPEPVEAAFDVLAIYIDRMQALIPMGDAPMTSA